MRKLSGCQFVLLFLLFLLNGKSLQAQTFNGSGGIIPDNGQAGVFNLNVNGLNPGILNTSFGLETVCINLTHPWVSDLRIRLIAPDGYDVLLTDGMGWDGDNYTNTCFNDGASTSILQGNPPFTGTFRPIENIGYHNNGQPGNGLWKLYILDTYPGADQGNLISWSITFGNNPQGPFPFNSSNLPIVLIHTNGQEIPDDPKIMAGFQIIDNGAGNPNALTDPPAYDGYIGIELRGSSSQSFPKKSYGIETWDAAGNDLDTTLLGMPSEADWILNANYTDKTLMRNAMAYQIWQDMGYYATRYRYVEVFINQRYKGVYILSEKIKRDKNRVDIAKLNPDHNSGDKLTGGYIVKIDKQTGSGGDGWISAFPPPVSPNGQNIYFQYEYPKADDITEPQKAYIQDYINQFETALAGPGFAHPGDGWRKYAREETFFDYFIVNEFSKNVDGYRLSTFLHKERDSKGGKIRMGPVWDYDLAWHNADYCDGFLHTGWAYQFPCEGDWWQVPFWWARLLDDTAYANNLNCRWNYLRGNILSNNAIMTYIDSIAGLLDGARQRNFTAWPILGHYVWPNPWPYPATYEEEIASLKNWISLRLAWLDNHMPGNCPTLGLPPDRAARACVSPNPGKGIFRLTLPEFHTYQQAVIVDAAGRQVFSLRISEGQTGYVVRLHDLSPGCYFLKLAGPSETLTKRLIILPD